MSLFRPVIFKISAVYNIPPSAISHIRNGTFKVVILGFPPGPNMFTNGDDILFIKWEFTYDDILRRV